uniref:ACT domain-containing protein ACR n=1 Tax=Chenopodium quinoa TaxID=63459 RepID=A0A803KS14_CHEQI
GGGAEDLDTETPSISTLGFRASMGIPNDDTVSIEKGKKSGDPWVITVNCPDKSGLGLDICRTILDFGLFISKGDVTHVLCELELNIERVKVTTTPDDRVLDLFFITDNLELLHTKERQGEAYERLRCVLGESCISCELQLADSHHEARKRTSSISPPVAEELFASEYSKKECHMQALSADLTQLKKAAVNVDNSLSPSHTLFQIHCVDHKVESSGRGRPRVFHDATLALKKLGICIFSAEIGRYSASDREWEVYRFLLDENCEYQLLTTNARNQIVDRVRRLLMGW